MLLPALIHLSAIATAALLQNRVSAQGLYQIMAKTQLEHGLISVLSL